MLNKYIISSIILTVLAVLPGPALASDIYGPNVELRNGSVQVTTGLRLDEKSIAEINKGVSKEIVFYIDLFRAWDRWPDEFVLGLTIAQNLRCDPVKKEYVVLTTRKDESTTRRFESCDQLLSWTMSLPDEWVTSLAGLDPEGRYYTKTTVESRLRRLPAYLRLLLFFVPETEFRLEKDSGLFNAGGVE